MQELSLQITAGMGTIALLLLCLGSNGWKPSAEGTRMLRAGEMKMILQCFSAMSTNYGGAEFLIYGVDKEWLIAHPEIKNASVEEQYRLIHGAGGLVVHAHPFREAGYIPEIRLFPEYVDGVEAINATHSSSMSQHHNNPEFDVRATAYAREHGLPMTAGSDIHDTSLLRGGMAFKRKIESIEDYCHAVLAGEDYILTNGDHWFDKKGTRL